MAGVRCLRRPPPSLPMEKEDGVDEPWLEFCEEGGEGEGALPCRPLRGGSSPGVLRRPIPKMGVVAPDRGGGWSVGSLFVSVCV